MRKRILIATASGILLLLLGIVLSVLAGAKDIPFDDVLHAPVSYTHLDVYKRQGCFEGL